MHNIYSLLLLLVVTLLLPDNLSAAEIKGTVIEAGADDTVKIATDSELVPNVGDEVRIFFTIPGSDVEVLVGTGRVTEVGADFVQAAIKSATGKVKREQLAKILSGNPQKKVAAPAKERTPSTTTMQGSEKPVQTREEQSGVPPPTVIGPWQPRNP